MTASADLRDLVAGLTELARHGAGEYHGRLEILLPPAGIPAAALAKLRGLGWHQATPHYDRLAPWFLDTKESKHD